ncbi:MAG: peptide ABC transporter substrate-binding protein [Acidobacteria bacterium]|nr:peptide ABC transporter substrate-binding protein [Acidobacteriota bacterium]
MHENSSQTPLGLAVFVLSLFLAGCSASAGSSKYWGRVDVPKDNVLRYITGSEPESLDPQFVTGQPEARIVIGLFDRLVEYHPKTMQPIPSMATHWESSESGDEYTFYLRKTGKFSNGDPIKAEDFVWSIRRGLSPELASRYGFLGYDIKYGEAYNAGKAFVKKDGKFLLAKDYSEDAPKGHSDADSGETCGLRTAECLTVSADEKTRNEAAKDDPKLKAAIEGAEFIPVKAEDIGVEAPDEYTVKFTLKQSAPYFVGMLTHQFFGALHRKSIEEFGKDWIKPGKIVTSGAFKLKSWNPYDELTIEKDPNYWDAANVSLDAIEFYPMDEATTMMNLYKSGRVDAIYNHTVPAAWNDYIKQFKAEYQLFPEVTTEYYTFSVKKPPVDNADVRRAFSLAIDRDALEKYRKTVKKSADFTPGIFPDYEKAREKVFAELAKKDGISPETFANRLFDPATACQLMEKAGYKVTKGNNNGCTVTGFPVDKIALSYNTSESNKQVAEFVQAQWKQNLGLTVPIKNMEWKTFLPYRSAVEYTGMARAGWVGDYMDPYTFLSQFYSPKNDSSTKWWDPKYDKMLDEANVTLDPEKRYEKLAEAEYYMLKDQPIIPLVTQGTSWMKKPYVMGMYPNPGTMHPWKFVYIEPDRTKWLADANEIMKTSDPRVDKKVDELMKTQIDFEASKASEKKEVETADE